MKYTNDKIKELVKEKFANKIINSNCLLIELYYNLLKLANTLGVLDDVVNVPQDESNVLQDVPQESIIGNPDNLKQVYQDAYDMYIKFPKEDLAKILAGYALEREANKQQEKVDYELLSSLKRKF